MGLIAGLIAKSVMHVQMTIVWTIVLGIIGSIIGGAVTHLFWRPGSGRFHPAGIIFSTLGARASGTKCQPVHELSLRDRCRVNSEKVLEQGLRKITRRA